MAIVCPTIPLPKCNIGTIITIVHMPLAYADDIDTNGLGLQDVTAAFLRIRKQSVEVSLLINENKLKLFDSTNNESFFDLTVNEKYNVSLEIASIDRIPLLLCSKQAI